MVARLRAGGYQRPGVVQGRSRAGEGLSPSLPPSACEHRGRGLELPQLGWFEFADTVRISRADDRTLPIKTTSVSTNGRLILDVSEEFG